MAFNLGRFKGFGSHASRFLLAGTLAVALTPAMAFADGDLAAGSISTQAASEAQSNAKASDKLLAKATKSGKTVTVTWPDGAWSNYNKDNDGTYVWSTFVKGDGNHYGHYALDLEFSVADGVLKAINVTSPDTAIGGSWSNYSSVTGLLPDGVTDSFTYDAEAKTITPVLSGVDAYGTGSVAGIAFYVASANEDGTVVLGDEYGPVEKTKQKNRKTGNEEEVLSLVKPDSSGSYSYDGNLGKGTASQKGTTYSEPDAANQPTPNLVKVSYKIGDWYSFVVYYDMNGGNFASDLNKFEYETAPSGIGAKNRDMWTQMAVASIVEQQLRGFVSNDDYEIDIVSSATKSSDAVIEALYASQGIYYPVSNNDNPTEATAPEGWSEKPIFTSVSDDLKVSLDGKVINGGKSSVAKTDAGYVLASNLTEGFDFADKANAVNIVGYDLFDMSTSTESDITKWLLSNVKSAYGKLDEDGKSKALVTPVAYAFSTAEGKQHAAKPELSAADGTVDGAAYDPDTNSITITNKDATHAIVWYNHDSHGYYAGVVYELDPERNLANAAVTLDSASAIYTGSAITPVVTVKSKNGVELKQDDDYTVSYASNTNVGTAIVTVTAKGNYMGSKVAKFAIEKAAASVTAPASVSKTFGDAAFDLGAKLAKGDGKLTYTTSDANVATVDANGKVTIKGAGSATITAKAAATANYNEASASTTLSVAKAASTATLKAKSATYTGKAISIAKATVKGSTGKVTYTYYTDSKCTKKASAHKAAGTYYVKASVAADANYNAATSKAVKLTIKPAANTFKVKAVKATQSASKTKATTIKAAKAFKVTKNASKGKVTYKKTSGNAKITVASNGKVTVKKGLKAGTYTVKVKATAAKTANYKAASATVTFKVKVK